MSKYEQTYNEFKAQESDNQVLSLWEKYENRMKRLQNDIDSESDMLFYIGILELLSKSQNKKEQYSSIYYIYKLFFKPIRNKLKSFNLVNNTQTLELEFQLARGLHHNRKYSESKKLFNQLAEKGFDTDKFDDWWDQSAYGSSRDKYWLKVDVLPYALRLALIILFIIVVIQTQEILFTSAIFIILFELLELYAYNLKINTYLKDYISLPECIEIKRKAKKVVLIEFILSLLVYPLYFWNQDWINFIVIGLILYLMTFSIGFSLRYLPDLIGELNRSSTTGNNAS